MDVDRQAIRDRHDKHAWYLFLYIILIGLMKQNWLVLQLQWVGVFSAFEMVCLELTVGCGTKRNRLFAQSTLKTFFEMASFYFAEMLAIYVNTQLAYPGHLIHLVDVLLWIVLLPPSVMSNGTCVNMISSRFTEIQLTKLSSIIFNGKTYLKDFMKNHASVSFLHLFQRILFYISCIDKKKSEYVVIITTEGSTKIVDFLTPRTDWSYSAGMWPYLCIDFFYKSF